MRATERTSAESAAPELIRHAPIANSALPSEDYCCCIPGLGVTISTAEEDFGSTRVIGTKVGEDAVSGFCCCRYFLSQEWRALIHRPYCQQRADRERSSYPPSASRHEDRPPVKQSSFGRKERHAKTHYKTRTLRAVKRKLQHVVQNP